MSRDLDSKSGIHHFYSFVNICVPTWSGAHRCLTLLGSSSMAIEAGITWLEKWGGTGYSLGTGRSAAVCDLCYRIQLLLLTLKPLMRRVSQVKHSQLNTDSLLFSHSFMPPPPPYTTHTPLTPEAGNEKPAGQRRQHEELEAPSIVSTMKILKI